MPNPIKSSKQTSKKSYYLLIRILGLNLTEKINLASTLMVLIPAKEGCLLTYYCETNAAVKKLVEH